MSIPIDTSLYKKATKYVKSRVAIWPSAYASGLLVKTYKKMGGKYKKSDQKRDQKSLKRWFEEKWVNICEKEKGRYKPCARGQLGLKKFPKCRPLYRISKKTPMTVKELIETYGVQKIKQLCVDKRKKGLPKATCKKGPYNVKCNKPMKPTYRQLI